MYIPFEETYQRLRAPLGLKGLQVSHGSASIQGTLTTVIRVTVSLLKLSSRERYSTLQQM